MDETKKTDETKSIGKSKNIWFFGLTLAASIGTAVMADESFKTLLGDNIEYVAGFMSVVGIALRFVTSKPIELSK